MTSTLRRNWMECLSCDIPANHGGERTRNVTEPLRPHADSPWGTFRQPSGPPHRFRRLMTALRSSSTVSDTRIQVNPRRWPSDWRLTLQLSHLSHQGKVTNSYCPMNSRWIFCLWCHFNLTFSQSLFKQSSEKSSILPLPFINHHTPLCSSFIAAYAPRNVVVGVLNDSWNRCLVTFRFACDHSSITTHHFAPPPQLHTHRGMMLLVYWMTLGIDVLWLFRREKSLLPYYDRVLRSPSLSCYYEFLSSFVFSFSSYTLYSQSNIS